LRAGVVAAYFATAYLAALAYTRVFGAATAIPLGLLVVVLVLVLTQVKRWRRESA
jgi:uncharacterized membrane protein (DUF485 family)